MSDPESSQMPEGECEASGDDDILYAERVINDLRYYSRYVDIVTAAEKEAVRKLPKDDKLLIIDVIQHWKRISECAAANQKVIDYMLTLCATSFGDPDLIQAFSIHQLRPSNEYRMSKVRSLFKQITRDWSSEGLEERQSCYHRPIRGLETRFPDVDSRHNVTVFVPGAGLGRLAYDLCNLGFSTIANEFDMLMIFASHFLINGKLKKDSQTIYPFLLDKLNCWSYDSQVLPITFPDVDVTQNRIRKNVFSFATGDFLGFKDEGQFDAIVSVFFLDTAENPITYLRNMYHILKPGGVLINFGPLLYHYADMDDKQSLNLPYDKIIEVVKAIGFDVQVDERMGQNPKAFYTRQKQSMLTYTYDCGYFEAVKPVG